ncbi:protein AKNAD1 [Heteronotia binoei]|uniref:protein AKNAD1 n=1 Tax=Heteronotia binoei TaxID=13085 RepID=UPI0029318DD2|nr:protein AKNAD1 [Heteronotia binoei]
MDHVRVNETLLDMLDYPEDNTDDEQEELPYDDDLQNIYPHNSDSQNVNNFTSIKNTSQTLFTLLSPQISNNSEEQSNCHTQHQRIKIHLQSSPRNNGTEIAMATKESPAQYFNSSGRNPHFLNSNISDVLLRHFPKEELSSSCQLIDYETIPEISLTESFDETILNKIKISESTKISSPKEKNAIEIQREEKCESIDKSWDLIEGKQFAVDERMNFSYERKNCKEDSPQFITQKEDTMNDVLKTEERYRDKCFLETSGSSHKFRYGQRQVNYQLPNFSKIAPKVKIPKGNNKSTPVIKRTKSSPDLLSKSTIVKDILEEMNYLDCVAMKKQEAEIKVPQLDQQLELLTKQAEAQNRIDHQRFNAKILPSPNGCSPKLGIKARSGGITPDISTVPPVTVPVKPMLGFSQTSVSELPSRRMVSPLPSAGASAVSPPLLQKATEGEKFSQMLKEQTEELKTKVEVFSKYMAQDVLPLEERHQILKLLKEYLEQLEWNYLDTKEKHCALHLQGYRHSSTDIGEFDPDRRVEGEIFKLGMLLEDIKEKIVKIGSPNNSVVTTSYSLAPCESYSSGPESPVISSISEPPSKTATGVNIFKNENRNHPVEMIIQQRTYQQPTKSSSCHPILQEQLEPQKRTVYEQRMEPLEKSRLPANEQSTHYCYFSSDKETSGLQSHRQFPTNQNYNHNQENTDGNLSYWEMKSPTPTNAYSISNKESNTTNLTLLKKQGNITYPSDHSFLEGLENSAKEHNIIIHPRLKIQLSSKPNKQIYTSTSSRNNKAEYKQTSSVKADSERFSIFLEGTTVDLDVSGSDTEDTPFVELKNKSTELFLEPKTKHHELWRADAREQKGESFHAVTFSCLLFISEALPQRDRKSHFNSERKRSNFEKSNECGIACSHKKNLALQRFCFNKPPEEFIYKLSDRQNLHIPKTHYSRMYDTIILSPQYLDSRNIHGRSVSELRNKQIEDTESKILNSTLDHVIQTANSLKRTTEHMVHVISEDLARAKTQTSPNVTPNQYYI